MKQTSKSSTTTESLLAFRGEVTVAGIGSEQATPRFAGSFQNWFSMWVGAEFRGDADKELMETQHDLYGEALGYLFCEAREEFLRAERMLDERTMLGLAIENERGFDHRVLQEAHDLIAAEFRYQRADLQQPPLPFDSIAERKRLEEQWRSFVRAEAKQLAREPKTCRAILTTVAYQNTKLGYQAEDSLEALLVERYSLFRSGLAGTRWGRRVPDKSLK